MAESHVVSALVSKRAEIAGLIARKEQQLGQFRADLVHLNATLRLFAPGLEPKTIPAKRNPASRSLVRAWRIAAARARRASSGGGTDPRARCRPRRDDRQGSRPCRSPKLCAGSMEGQGYTEEPQQTRAACSGRRWSWRPLADRRSRGLT